MFGTSAGSELGSSRRLCVDSASVSPAVAEGVGGKGRDNSSAGVLAEVPIFSSMGSVGASLWTLRSDVCELREI